MFYSWRTSPRPTARSGEASPERSRMGSSS